MTSHSRHSVTAVTRVSGRRPLSRRPVSCVEEVIMSQQEKLKLPQVLAELDMSRSAFYRMRALGKGPKCLKLPNGQLRIRRSDLDAWLLACEELPC